MTEKASNDPMQSVAVIGMAGRFPGASSISELWENLLQGLESIEHFGESELSPSIPPEVARHARYVKARGVLPDVEMFDAGFFGLTPVEASIMDPQQRIFLETVWSALEDAAVVPADFEGLIGTYAGSGPNTYFAHHVSARRDLLERVGDYLVRVLSDPEYLSTRASYELNLRGPSLSINTACSTSLVAICEAFTHLLTYQCDIAIAGGVEITTPQASGTMWQQGSIFSRNGHCRPFDEHSDGIVPGNGVGVVVLERLEDAIEAKRRIYAVIRGSAVNNDGSNKVGFTAPSVTGQVEAISLAIAQSSIDPASVALIETHGTGTQLGDPIEIEALKKSYRDLEGSTCAIGALKGNIGHLGSAAGAAGFIKAALAVYHGSIPPTIHSGRPNPQLQLEESPFFINTDPMPFPERPGPRRAAVSSFGIGGTNAHVVIEEAPPASIRETCDSRELLLLSAKNPSALSRAREQLAEYLSAHPALSLADVANTLQNGRTHFDFRDFVVCADAGDAVGQLEVEKEQPASATMPSTSRPVVFVFPGQGSQAAGVSGCLYARDADYRSDIDTCAEILASFMGMDMRELLFPEAGAFDEAAETLNQTRFTQPALFMIEYALAKLWMRWGVHPEAMLGHSVGEFVAACLSGVFSLEDALMLISERGHLIQECDTGSMLAVELEEGTIATRLGGSKTISIAAINSPSQCVVSGPRVDIERFASDLKEEKIPCKLLRTSHAFHSTMMIPAAKAFEESLARVSWSSPEKPFVSTLTGTWADAQSVARPEHWGHHIVSPVRFSEGVATLWKNPDRILLEIGPGMTASALARRQLVDRKRQIALSCLMDHKEKDEWGALLKALGTLWSRGVNVDWRAVYRGADRSFLSLPSYPFARHRHWLDPVRVDHASYTFSLDAGASAKAASADDQSRPPSAVRDGTDAAAPEPLAPSLNAPLPAAVSTGEAMLLEMWSEFLGCSDLRPTDSFFDIGGHSLLAVQLVEHMNSRFDRTISTEEFFANPTVRELLKLVQAGDGDPSPSPNEESAVLRADLSRLAKTIEGAASASPMRGRRMRESRLAKWILAPLYSRGGGRLRSVLQVIILRLEHGPMYSLTMRRLFSKHFDMEVGEYSAFCFNAGNFKPGTRFGRYCSIMNTARFETANHPSNTISTHGVFYHSEMGFSPGYDIPRNRIEIGHDVFIGHNATILHPASRVGNGAIIGAGSVVTEDVPPYAVVSGDPAKIIRYRFTEKKIRELAALEWWNLSLEQLDEVRDEFIRPVEGRFIR